MNSPADESRKNGRQSIQTAVTPSEETKMRSAYTTAVVLVLSMASVRVSAQSAPRLKETLGWIQDSLKDGDGDVERQTDKGTEIHEFRLVDFSSCRVHFLLTETILGKETFHEDDSFDIGVIDPGKVRFGRGMASNPGVFTAVTQNLINKIATKNTYGVSSIPATEGRSNMLVEYFYGPYGDDFAEAFTLAVKTCGGKPSIFGKSKEGDSDWGITPVASAIDAQSASSRKDIPAIAKAANGAIVTIVTADNDKPIAQGTGFVVTPDGAIVTNYHVIETGNVAFVKFPDGTILPVDGVLAADKVRDLAVIKIHGKTFRTLALGNSDHIQVGEEVVAIGNPESFESTVSNGIISGVRTDKEVGGKFLQITAPITHGSSGGPLFNMMGEVVGITTLGFAGGGDLNFAIPVNDAKLMLQNRSANLQNLPNEPEPPKELPKVPTTLPSEDQNMNSPAYQQFQELLKAGDLTITTGIYACFYDSSKLNRHFFVISAQTIDKHTMTAATNSFVDGVQNDSPSLFTGKIQEPFSSEHGVAADLPTMYDYKDSADKSHESDVFKWLDGDITIEHGFGKLIPGQVRFSSRFKLQRSTGRFVEDTVFDKGTEPNGFTTHETGRCIRIPNIVETPEEQYRSFSNHAEEAPTAPTRSGNSLPPNTKVAATPIGSTTQPATMQQLQEDMTYCYQHPANNLQASNGELVACSEVNASRLGQEVQCKTGSEAKSNGCRDFLKFVEDLKAGRL